MSYNETRGMGVVVSLRMEVVMNAPFLFRGLALVGVLWLFGGCLSFGKEFSTDTSWIKVKETSQSEVTQKLGVPQEIGLVSGVKFWSYYYYEFSLLEDHSRRDLKIYWNSDLTVKSYSLSSSPKDFSAGKSAEKKKPTKSQKSP